MCHKWLSYIAIIPAFVTALPGQSDPVQVEVGRPNIWSLEQAHYLLSRMHAENLGLKATDLDDLDPNEIHGTRIDIVRSLFSVGVGFDERAAQQNRIGLADLQAQADRRDLQRNQLDELRQRSFDLTQRIAQLPGDDPGLPALNAEKTAVDARIASLQTDLSAPLSAPPLQSAETGGGDDIGNLTSADPLSRALAETPSSVFESNLHASTMLDNHIQMQYEIIAKQLTLLRDEVGHGERLVFLELPISIYTQPKKARKRLVRVAWKIEQICALDRFEPQQFRNLKKDLNAYFQGGSATSYGTDGAPWLLDEILRDCAPPASVRARALAGGPGLLRNYIQWRNTVKSSTGRAAEREVRTIDVIPRTSALNVTQIYNRQRGFSIGAQLQWLFGFGLIPNFQRDRRTYDQFVHQKAFATGFGMGMKSFGWVFGPVPGTQIISPGARTTFAVVVIPRDALFLKLKAEACSFKRKVLPALPFAAIAARGSSCQIEEFLVPVPLHNQAASFWLDEVRYTPVRRGSRITVEFAGNYFSPQIGLLVNGVALRRVVAIADRRLADRSGSPPASGDNGVRGEFELVNSEKIIAHFEMGSDYVGTPIISFVTPQKARVINNLTLEINGLVTKLDAIHQEQPMFRAPLEIRSLEVLAGGGAGPFPAVLHGQGFRNGAEITINGHRASLGAAALPTATFKSTNVYDLKLGVALIRQGEWSIRMNQDGLQGVEETSTTLSNSTLPRITAFDILDWKRPNTSGIAWFRVKLEGRNFDRNLQVSVTDQHGVPSLTRVSESEVEVEYETIATSTVQVTLTRPGSQVSASRSIPFPYEPTVTSVSNAAEKGKPEGAAKGGYNVSIVGRFFNEVAQVRFGDIVAAILSRSANGEVLLVKVPKGDKGEKVQVRLLTGIRLRGSLVSNAADFQADPKPIFTYKE